MDTEYYDTIITHLENIETAIYEYGDAFDSYLQDIVSVVENWIPIIAIGLIIVIGLKVLYNSLR